MSKVVNFFRRLQKDETYSGAVREYSVSVPVDMVPQLVLASKRLKMPISSLLNTCVRVGIETMYKEVTA